MQRGVWGNEIAPALHQVCVRDTGSRWKGALKAQREPLPCPRSVRDLRGQVQRGGLGGFRVPALCQAWDRQEGDLAQDPTGVEEGDVD